MDNDLQSELLEKLNRIDRRIGIVGDIAIPCVCFVAAWLAYRLVKTDLGFGEFPAGIAALVAWCVLGGALGKEFYK
jgi:hypothetical protein